MKPRYSKIFTPIILLIFLVTLLGFAVSLSATSHEPPAAGAAGTTATTPPQPKKEVECSEGGRDEVKRLIQEESQEFGDYMTTHFRNDADASTLLPAAIQHFKIYALKLYSAVDAIPITDVESQLRRTSCKKLVDAHLFVMKQVFKTHVTLNAQGKKATKLVSKYKEINDKLEKLNFQVSQMYGYFLTFSKKLPCYAPQCN